MSELTAYFLAVIKEFQPRLGEMPEFIRANQLWLSRIPQHEKRLVWDAMQGRVA